MIIHLRIDRLVVDGLPATRSDGPVIQAAVEAELGRLLTGEGLPPTVLGNGVLPYLRAGDLRISPHPHPAFLGRQIAGAVYRGIGQGGMRQ